MRTSWYRRLFTRRPVAAASNVRARAEAGDTQAQMAMAVASRGAAAGPREAGDAAVWYRKAAEQNLAQAQFDLGMLCADGEGVPRDEAEALRWLRKAAQQGHAEAQYHLGVRCRRATFGRQRPETTESRIEAYTWLLLAKEQGSREALVAWEQMALDMSAEEVAEGNLRAGRFGAPTSDAR